MEVSGQFHALAALTVGKEPLGHIMMLSALQSRYGRCRLKMYISCLCQESNSRFFFVRPVTHLDRLCGLVVRVSGYRYRGLGFDSRRYQIF